MNPNLIDKILNSRPGRGKGKSRMDLGISPYYESPSNLAEVCGVSTYVVEWGCRFTHVVSLRKNRSKAFRKTIEKEATGFYGVDSLEEFEAHFIDGDKKLIVVVTQGHSSLNCSLFSNVGIEHIFDFIKKHERAFTRQNYGEIEVSYFYLSARNGFSSSRLYVTKSKLSPIHPELYPDIDINLLLDAYTESRESVLMLYGPPGVGKTTFIKFLLAAGDFQSVAYVKDPQVMGMGELWGKLSGGDYDLVIFDDLDLGLLPRQKSKDGNFMSQLLSFSDGIFHSNKTKIIITTNQHIGEIDSALVRPGRCFDFINLNCLTREQALHAWTNLLELDEDRFNATFKDAEEITQAALMSEATFRHAANTRDYIKSGERHYTLDQKLEALNIKISGGEAGSGSEFGFKK